jgi:hypothetical protein
MYLYKDHIDQYLKCPYYFAIILLNKTDIDRVASKTLQEFLSKTAKVRSYKTIDNMMDKDVLWVKDMVSKFALQEMETEKKCSLHEYRISYTNKYAKELRLENSDVKKKLEFINNMFSIFANNIFIGYNVPVEIPINKTNIIFRDIIDFIVADVFDQDKLTIIEFDHLNDSVNKSKYSCYDHYRISYAFISKSLNKPLDVLIIDPTINCITVKYSYKPSEFDNIYNSFADMARLFSHPLVYKNLNSCNECALKEICFG